MWNKFHSGTLDYWSTSKRTNVLFIRKLDRYCIAATPLPNSNILMTYISSHITHFDLNP